MGATPVEDSPAEAGEVLSTEAEDAVREIVLEMLDHGSTSTRTDGTLRQLAHQVDKGRRISFHSTEGGEPVTGYLFGWDPPSVRGPNYWFVMVPHDDDEPPWIEQQLIPQEGTRLTLHRQETFENEAQYSEMDKIVRAFRYRVNKSVLKKSK